MNDQADRFKFERDLWRRGLTHVAGVVEAGRGPLAGPVVAAAVIFPPAWLEAGLPAALEGLNDSKQLRPGQRDLYFDALTARSDLQFAVACVDAGIVDEINILRASHRA